MAIPRGVAVVIAGGTAIFGAPLTVGIPFFILSVALAIAEIFALGLVLVSLAPTQTVASAAGGVLFFGLLFLSGLWIQPVQVAGPLRKSCGTRRAARRYGPFSTRCSMRHLR